MKKRGVVQRYFTKNQCNHGNEYHSESVASTYHEKYNNASKWDKWYAHDTHGFLCLAYLWPTYSKIDIVVNFKHAKDNHMPPKDIWLSSPKQIKNIIMTKQFNTPFILMA